MKRSYEGTYDSITISRHFEFLYGTATRWLSAKRDANFVVDVNLRARRRGAAIVFTLHGALSLLPVLYENLTRRSDAALLCLH